MTTKISFHRPFGSLSRDTEATESKHPTGMKQTFTCDRTRH